jgi:hypothetical protein
MEGVVQLCGGDEYLDYDDVVCQNVRRWVVPTMRHGGGEISGYLVYLHSHTLRADSSLSFTSLRPDLGMVAYRTPTRGAFYFVHDQHCG